MKEYILPSLEREYLPDQGPQTDYVLPPLPPEVLDEPYDGSRVICIANNQGHPPFRLTRQVYEVIERANLGDPNVIDMTWAPSTDIVISKKNGDLRFRTGRQEEWQNVEGAGNQKPLTFFWGNMTGCIASLVAIDQGEEISISALHTNPHYFHWGCIRPSNLGRRLIPESKEAQRNICDRIGQCLRGLLTEPKPKPEESFPKAAACFFRMAYFLEKQGQLKIAKADLKAHAFDDNSVHVFKYPHCHSDRSKPDDRIAMATLMPDGTIKCHTRLGDHIVKLLPATN